MGSPTDSILAFVASSSMEPDLNLLGIQQAAGLALDVIPSWVRLVLVRGRTGNRARSVTGIHLRRLGFSTDLDLGADMNPTSISCLVASRGPGRSQTDSILGMVVASLLEPRLSLPGESGCCRTRRRI